MPVDVIELTALLRSSRNRVLHLIGAFGVLVLGVTIEAVVKLATNFEDGDGSNLIVWGIGCGGFSLFAVWWYRARARASEQLLAAVRGGWSLYSCRSTAVLLKRIPAGYEVDMTAVDAARETSVHLAFGFWTLSAANRLIAVLEPCVRSGPPPGIPIKMRAPVRR